MKYLKKFDESIFGDLFKKKYRFIDGTYTKNPDGSIDVVGSVNFGDEIYTSPRMNEHSMSSFPVKFGKVSGDFSCCYGKLTSLKGAPEYVGGEFYVNDNFLTTLEYSPKTVGGSFKCNNNNLSSLEGGPENVGLYFNCSDNYLTSLKGAPKKIGSIIACMNNEIIDFYDFDVDDIAASYSTISVIDCRDNPIEEIYRLCPTKEFIKYLNEFRPIRGNTILGKRLEECLYMCDITHIDVSSYHAFYNLKNKCDIELDVTKLKFKNYTLLE